MNLDFLTKNRRPEPSRRSNPGGPVNVVVLHNHVRFVRMARSFVESSLRPIASLSSYELNQLAEGKGSHPIEEAATLPDARSSEPADDLRSRSQDRFPGPSALRTVICVGIDTSVDLPPMWRIMLWSVITQQPNAGGSLVYFEDRGPGEHEMSAFLEDLALIGELDFVRANGRPW
ncbi:hypothetical protein [Haloferula sargassicola]|uniref:hypothetical protein n=1 Tax=Haloferula sargassicola TaxID=490096 RepID=UPI0033657624